MFLSIKLLTGTFFSIITNFCTKKNRYNDVKSCLKITPSNGSSVPSVGKGEFHDLKIYICFLTLLVWSELPSTLVMSLL